MARLSTPGARGCYLDGVPEIREFRLVVFVIDRSDAFDSLIKQRKCTRVSETCIEIAISRRCYDWYTRPSGPQDRLVEQSGISNAPEGHVDNCASPQVARRAVRGPSSRLCAL